MVSTKQAMNMDEYAVAILDCHEQLGIKPKSALEITMKLQIRQFH